MASYAMYLAIVAAYHAYKFNIIINNHTTICHLPFYGHHQSIMVAAAQYALLRMNNNEYYEKQALIIIIITSKQSR